MNFFKMLHNERDQQVDENNNNINGFSQKIKMVHPHNSELALRIFFYNVHINGFSKKVLV